MKKVYSIFVCLCMLAGFVACDKDNDFALTTLTVTNETVTPSYETAEVSCSFKADATISEAYVQYSLSSSFADYEVAKMAEEKGRYTALLTGLVDNTTYYIRYTVSNKFSNVVADAVEEFQTLSCTVPTIVLDSIGGVRESHAKAYMHLTFDGGASVTDMGICWSTEVSPTIEDIHKSTKDTAAVLDITNLQENTKYYVRAYAVNRVGTAYSEEQVFTTYALPEVRTEEVTDIQVNTALLSATLLFDGNDTATVKGFCWSDKAEPTIDGNHIAIDTTSAHYTYVLSDLLPATEYHVRAYAQNKIGLVYGEEKTFTTTKEVFSPTVTTATITQITETTAVAGGDVTSDGNADVMERGVCISTVSNPTTSNTKVTSGNGTGAFTCNLTDLQPNTKYYVRAYAINEKGTAYGEEVNFTTSKQVVIPTVTTSTVTQITETTAVAGGNVTSDGNADVTECGVCISTVSNPTTSNTKVTSGNGTGAFTCNLTDLQPNTKYYVRAYAVNEKGTAYGEEVNFTTSKQVVIPTVTTSAVTQITETTAVAGGNVTSDGNADVTERGVVYSTNPNPVITNLSNTIRPCGSGMGEFTYTITGLQPSTKYYVRAYAKNDAGTAYGEEVSCTTLSQQPTTQLPTVTTSVATQITATTAVAGGNVTSEGGASVTERGVCIATISNPTTANTKIPAGSGTGEFTCEITGLQEGTKYYIRAYAVNSEGTAYGEEEEFTTAVVTTPTLTTSEVTQITETSAVAGGNVTSDGNASVTERGVVYSLSATPAINDLSSTIVRSGSGTGVFTCNLSNLQAGTKYYVRAYAVNDKGTAYGEVVSFTTAVPITLATVTTATVSNITENTAVAGGAVTNDGNSSVTDRGVCIATVSNPTTAHTKISAGSGMGTFTCNLTGLQANTKYYIRAYAVNSKGTAYGEELTFTTAKPIVLPTVTTDIVTQISVRTAVAGGNVTSDGNASVTERGVVYATSQNPTTSSTKVVAGSGTGSFTCDLTNLQPNTTYYVRAYATNSMGTAYGEEVSFTTKKEDIDNPPSNLTAMPFSVSVSKQVFFSKGNLQYHPANDEWRFAESQLDYIGDANSNCSSSYNGWLDLFGWSTSSTNFGVSTSEDNADYSGSFVDWGKNKIGNNASNMWRTLTYDEWEYIMFNRSNADNLKGIAQVNGVNGLILLPDEWTCPNGVTFKSGFYSSFDVIGYEKFQKFTADQWSKLEAVGAVFLPASASRNGSNVGDWQYTGCYWSSTGFDGGARYLLFRSDGVELQNSSRYMGHLVRLAKDWQQEIVVVSPTIITSTVTQITETTAVAGGNVTSDGNASVTERGVCVATASNPTTSNTKITAGSGTGSFTCNLAGLQSSTTYYVRAYAINSKGTAYGEEVSFTTNEEMVDNPPSNLVAMPFSVSAGKQVTFSQGNLQYTQSTNTWSFAKNQWDMIGTDNVIGGGVTSDPTYGYDKKDGTALADKVDLFGWSTSATNFGVSTSRDKNDFSGSFVDWGANTIGDDAPNTWRTLTKDEWNYLRHVRTNANDLVGVAQVNGVNGLILLPDNWTCPAGITFKSGFYSERGVNYYAAYQTFTAEQWSKLESAGAVFLPAAGYRYGLSVYNVQYGGDYCSASEGGSDYANFLFFYSKEADMGGHSRSFARAVRLVKDL